MEINVNKKTTEYANAGEINARKQGVNELQK